MMASMLVLVVVVPRATGMGVLGVLVPTGMGVLEAAGTHPCMQTSR